MQHQPPPIDSGARGSFQPTIATLGVQFLSSFYPWCCILTHNLFISVKFWRTKWTESFTLPPSLQFKRGNQWVILNNEIRGRMTSLPLKFWANLRELILRHLRQIVPQEQAAGGMLFTPAHFHQIAQHLLGWSFLCLDVNRTHSNQEIP